MKKLVNKDKKRRKVVKNFEKKKKILISIFKNTSLSTFIRWNASNSLTILPKDVNEVRLNQRCIVTGRNTKIHKIYKFSRLKFLHLAREGSISGLRNSSW